MMCDSVYIYYKIQFDFYLTGFILGTGISWLAGFFALKSKRLLSRATWQKPLCFGPWLIFAPTQLGVHGNVPLNTSLRSSSIQDCKFLPQRPQGLLQGSTCKQTSCTQVSLAPWADNVAPCHSVLKPRRWLGAAVSMLLNWPSTYGAEVFGKRGGGCRAGAGYHFFRLLHWDAEHPGIQTWPFVSLGCQVGRQNLWWSMAS